MIFGISVIISCITLSLGYLVLTKAVKQEGKLKTIGKVIGWFVIAMSIIGMLCAGTMTRGMKMKGCHKKGHCHHMKKGVCCVEKAAESETQKAE
jgi:hypothetical protein